MTQTTFNPDDPRLTAYVLGELESKDVSEFEEFLAVCPEAQSALEEIKDTISQLKLDLSAESAPTLTAEQRARVEQAATTGVVPPIAVSRGSAARSVRLRLARYGILSAAALVGIVAVLPKIQQSGSEADSTMLARTESLRRVTDTSSPEMAALARGSNLEAGGSADHEVDSLEHLKLVGGRSNVLADALGLAQASEAAEAPAESSLASSPGLPAQSLVASDFSAGPQSGEGQRPGDEKRAMPRSEPVRTGTSVAAADRPAVVDGYAVPPTAVRPTAVTESKPALAPAGASQAGRLIELHVSNSSPATAAALSDGEGRQQADRLIGMRGTSPADESIERLRRRSLEAEVLGESVSGEAYQPIVENSFIRPSDQPLSTFSIDVDSGSYSNVRRFLTRNQLPPPDAVRIEELINYFRYTYPQPNDEEPFSVNTEVAACPWRPEHRLVRIGLKGREIDHQKRPPTNLVFLLDVSGSMRSANKLPLVKQAMTLLSEGMTEDDQIAIVTYAGNAGLHLESTSGAKQSEIRQAIDSLQAGGSTNGEGGIRMAYDVAVRTFINEGANRVILCSDGDFNVGTSNNDELVQLIKEKAASGVFLSVFGFGMGNLKDDRLEKIADHGNGQYGYIDNFNEARRVFSEELTGTLFTIAKDVKLQVEFNPATVGAYRLIGYENRVLAAQDFNDDTKDAGEIGAGHTVTALYEVVPKDVFLNPAGQAPLKYQDRPAEAAPEKPASSELFTVHLRYKRPDAETSDLMADYPVQDINAEQAVQPSSDFQFAAAVASFGMNLRHSAYRGTWGYQQVLQTAQQNMGDDADGHRAEFLDLVRSAIRITGGTPATSIEPREDVGPRPPVLDADAARIKAAVDGRYRRLLMKIEVEDDFSRYGAFHNFGHWDGADYKGHTGLLPGFWVYVYPHWYIWGEDLKPEAAPAGKSE